jgi:uncharacterized membrane protein YfcA
MESLPLLVPAIFVVALLYASVGHAGASGYIAVMALAGLPPAVIRPTALILNIFVASQGSWQFWRAGHFSWRLFWPFALLSIPCAYLGGYLNLPTRGFKIVVGVVLLASAARFFLRPREAERTRTPRLAAAMPIGGGLGLLAGLTGTGGGIFLTPVVILAGWAKTKTAAAISSMFILVNSAAGLLGNVSASRQVPALALPLLASAICGGVLGSYLGSRRLPAPVIQRLLAVVLLLAGSKLVLGR